MAEDAGEVLRGLDLMVQGAVAVDRAWSHGIWERAEELERARGARRIEERVIPVSFDEWVVELMAWRDAVREAAREAVAPPAVGSRVVFKRSFGEYPLERMPAGEAGTVVSVGDVPPFIAVRLDRRFAQLDDWDNEFHFSGSPDETAGEACVDFHATCGPA